MSSNTYSDHSFSQSNSNPDTTQTPNNTYSDHSFSCPSLLQKTSASLALFASGANPHHPKRDKKLYKKRAKEWRQNPAALHHLLSSKRPEDCMLKENEFTDIVSCKRSLFNPKR